MKKIDEIAANAHTIAISGHIKPDGDCVGSVLALYNYLRSNNPEKDVDVFLEEPSEKYRFLHGYDSICFSFDREKTYDLMICLDCSTLDRLGKARRYFESADQTVCIDHHISNTGYADENYIEGEISSACEVLYHFLEPKKLNREIAICLYTGIISDTGVFKYPATTPDTLRVAASLMEFGIPTNEIIDESFYARDYKENRILGYAVLHSRLAMDGRVIYSYITDAKMREFGVTTKELDGIVPQLRLTRGVDCAVFLYETGNYQYKVSFRTTEAVDANEIASLFGGGGHARAAGCNVTGELDTCIEAILTEVARAL